MKKVMFIFSLILIASIAIISCGDDDNPAAPKNVLPESWPWTVNGTLTDSSGKSFSFLDNNPGISLVGTKYSIETSSGDSKLYIKLPKVLTSGTTSECTVFYRGLTMPGQKASYNIVYTGDDAYAGTISVIGRYGTKTIVGWNVKFKIRLN